MTIEAAPNDVEIRAAAAAVTCGDFSDAWMLNSDELAAATLDLSGMAQAVDEAIEAAPTEPESDGPGFDADGMRAEITRQYPEMFTVPVPYHATPPMQQWTCDDTFTELVGGKPRVLPMRPVPSGVELTFSDYFAGAGGSSSGIHQVPGCHVKIAVNHWPLAIETHNFNHPDTDHDTANVARTDPRRYPSTDVGWFSPECTNWSVAKGEKCDYDEASQQTALDVFDGDPETPEAKEAKWRSRMLMRDVVRFSEVHRYKAVIVENVPDILKWAAMDRWLGDMYDMGYKHKVISLNSAFAHALGDPAPQLRDRVYVVFWQARYKTPNWDKWLRPQGYCPGCEEVVRAIYNPKPGKRRPMRYGQRAQYTYRCPKTSCRGQMVQPLVMPAGAVIDWSLPAERIGDRKRPLAPKTRARVAAGLARYCRPAGTQSAGGKSLAAGPEMLVPSGGTWNDDATLLDRPMRATTTRENTALVVPLRNNGNAVPPSAPLRTVAAGGEHHALVMRNMTARGDQGQMSTRVSEPLRTFTTQGGQSLVRWDNHKLYAFDTGRMRPLDEPLPAQTTVEGDAVVHQAVDVDDCTLRMLAVREIQAGMAFSAGYVLLGTAKKDKVKMLGNAVTPPSSRDLAACVMEAITGIDIPLYELGR